MKQGEIVVYSAAWGADQQLADGDPDGPISLLHSRIVVEGREIKSAFKIEATAQGRDFASATIYLNPSSVRFVGLTKEQWALDDLSELEGDPS